MKKTNKIYAILILLIGLTASSCCSILTTSKKDCANQKRKLQLVRNISYNKLQVLVNQSDDCEEGLEAMCLSSEEKDVILALRASECEPAKIIYAIDSGEVCQEVICEEKCLDCCIPKSYCGIDMEIFKTALTNYRDDIWGKTSNYFDNNGITCNQAAMTNIYNPPSSNPNPLDDPDNFDARFMDIPIAELQSYLCTIKNVPYCSTANTIRIYYIKHDIITQDDVDANPRLKKSWSGKHSIALVPVDKNPDTGKTEKEFTEGVKNGTLIFTPGIGDCQETPIVNHNMLCPPFGDCIKNTMIDKVDNQ